MRLLFIRHGDPDYVHDSLTEKGKKEAALLSELAPFMGMDICYQSPLGRAQKTAAFSLDRLGKQAKTLPWLREFDPALDLNKASDELIAAYPDTEKNEDGSFRKRNCWDILPSYVNRHQELLSPVDFKTGEVAACSSLAAEYDYVTKSFDELLASYGYVRDGFIYRVEKECKETLVFFCHYGVTCVLLSHLMNCSPFVLWNGTVMAPSSVTELHSEEREQGYAWFRASKIGDISHLRPGGEEPSFAARFCEVYSCKQQRH